MYRRRGYYYFDCPVNKRWIGLGDDLPAAMDQYAKLATAGRVRYIPPSMARTLFLRARRGAKQRGIDFLITQSYIEHLLKVAGKRCSISGMPLTITTDGAWFRNPWAPSIDRIDSKLPYQEGNCRVVCYAANVALNEWGIEVLASLAQGILDKRRFVRQNSVRSVA